MITLYRRRGRWLLTLKWNGTIRLWFYWWTRLTLRPWAWRFGPAQPPPYQRLRVAVLCWELALA